MEIPIIIFGAKEKGKIALDILQSTGHLIYGLLVEDKQTHPAEDEWSDIPLLGSIADKECLALLGEKYHPFVALQKKATAQKILKNLDKRKILKPLNAIHPAATLAKSIKILAGNIINVGSSIGPEVTIHSYCSLMGHNMIGYGTTLHDFVHLAPGVIVSPGVTIGEGAHIGTGAILQENITIGEGATIAPGAIIAEDVPPHTIAIGNTEKTTLFKTVK